MNSIAGATGIAVAHPNPNTKPGRRRHHRPRDRYADAGRSAREALDRLRAAEREARAEGRTVPPSCARVLLEVVGHLTTYSRRNDFLPVSRAATDSQPGGLVERTGYSRNTIRRALALLESWGCITRITPENVKGTKTGPTLIALPIVEPPGHHEHDADELEDEDAHQGQHEHAHQPVPMLTRSPWTDPGPVTLDAPGSRSPWTDPLTRSTYEKEVRAQPQREARQGRPPDGRSKDRPASYLEATPNPTPSPTGYITAEDASAAEDRMRDDLDAGRGVNPADVRIVDEWAAQQRRAERGEVAA
ncbi:MAG: hypothetical protein ACO3PB_07755 [Miltoncostaeaceae bacterium]